MLKQAKGPVQGNASAKTLVLTALYDLRPMAVMLVHMTRKLFLGCTVFFSKSPAPGVL